MTHNNPESKNVKYINQYILSLKKILLEPVTEGCEFEVWFEGLPEETKMKIEIEYKILAQKLSKELMDKKVITKESAEKIAYHITKKILKVLQKLQDVDLRQENNFIKSTKKILEIYNNLIAITWIQEARAKNFSFDYLIEQIKTRYPNKNDESLYELCTNTNFLEYLTDFGLYFQNDLDKEDKKSKQERIYLKLLEIHDHPRQIKKVFINAKKNRENAQLKILTELIDLVVKNHAKKLVLIATLTLFESSTRAFSLNFLANSLADKNTDNALMALGLILASQISNSVIRTSQGLINNFMQYGSGDETINFDGLEAMLIKVIKDDPFLAQKYDPVNLKSFLQKIEKEYQDLYNITFNNLIPNIFSVLGSVLSATALLKGSVATIIPPLISIMLNFLAQEKRNQLLMPLRSKLITFGASTDTLMQSLIAEISKRLNIRDIEKSIKEVMPELLKINNKVMAVDESFFLFRQISVSTAIYAGFSILGIKLDNSALKALFGGDLNNTFGMAMLQTQTSFETANLISGIKGLNLTQEIIYKNFITTLSNPMIEGFKIKSIDIEFKDFSLFTNHAEKSQSKAIKSGSLVYINGANGTGKSTLLNLLSKQVSEKPFLGHLIIGNVPIHLIDNKQYQELIISMPQNIDTFSGSIALNVAGKENLDKEILELFVESPLAQNLGYKIFNVEWIKWSKKDHENWWIENIDKVLIGTAFKIKDRNGDEVEAKIDSLSGGEQKMLGILRVINKLSESDGIFKILTLDEPIANLSYVTNEETKFTDSIYNWMQYQILMIMKKYPKTTVFFIDHSQSKDSLLNQITQDKELGLRLQTFAM